MQRTTKGKILKISALVLDVGAFFLNYAVSFFHRFVKYAFKPNYVAFPCGHRAFGKRYHSVSYVNAVFRPVAAHEFKHLEKLFEVQVLLVRHDVKTFVKVIGLFAVKSRRKVAGGVKGSAVSLYEKARRHTVFLQIDDFGSVAFLDETFPVQFLNRDDDHRPVSGTGIFGIAASEKGIDKSLGFCRRSDRVAP